MILPCPLHRTLVGTIDAMQQARDPWWIISGAAVALHGVSPVTVGDVDLLLSMRDAHVLLDTLGAAATIDSGSPRFQSTVFARWTEMPLTVDIMADFRVATAAGWVRIAPRTRVAVQVEHRIAYVPDRKELAAMFRLFGRAKDFERAGLLDQRT